MSKILQHQVEIITGNVGREEYEDKLREKQRQHLDNITIRKNQQWKPCLHDGCTECIGTGIKKDGSPCVHMISCTCPKCSFH